MELTAEQIKQALECLAKCGECKESSCEYYMESNDVCMCDNISIAKDTLDYINHLEAENEKLVGKCVLKKGKVKRLKEELKTVAVDQKIVKAFAIKEFAERLKTELNNIARVKVDDYFCIGLGFIDNLAKEMVGNVDV